VEDTLKWADVVFAGEVTNVQYVDTQSDKLFNEPRIIVKFNVSGSWKGDVYKTMTLYTNYNKVSCSGLIVKAGDKFLIYAKQVKAKSWLGDASRQALKGGKFPKPEDDIFQDGGACGRSGPLLYANEDLKTLGIPKVPTK
jgi:hypothetical protein